MREKRCNKRLIKLNMCVVDATDLEINDFCLSKGHLLNPCVSYQVKDIIWTLFQEGLQWDRLWWTFCCCCWGGGVRLHAEWPSNHWFHTSTSRSVCGSASFLARVASESKCRSFWLWFGSLHRGSSLSEKAGTPCTAASLTRTNGLLHAVRRRGEERQLLLQEALPQTWSNSLHRAADHPVIHSNSGLKSACHHCTSNISTFFTKTVQKKSKDWYILN